MGDERTVDPGPPGAPDGQAAAEPPTAVGVLDAQALLVRTELAALSSTLATVQQALDVDRIAELLAAKEQLVRAALLADSIAEDALRSLAERSMSRQSDPSIPAGSPSTRVMELESAVAAARRRQTPLAVIVVGWEGATDLSGTPTPAVGEAVLRAVTHRLQSVLRRADTLSGEAGEACLTLIAELAQINDVALIAARLLAALVVPLQVDGRQLRLTARLGIALYPLDGPDASLLLGRAKAAMRRAQQEPADAVKYASDLGALAGEAPGPAAPRAPLVPPAPAVSGAPIATALQAQALSQDLREANERLVIAAVHSLQQQSEAQDEARELQVRFLAMVAHELRNPLLPIRSAAELLFKARNDEALLARLQGVIKRQVIQMARLVDDLLDASRITSGKYRLERERVDLMAVLRVARDACQPAIELRHQTLGWDVVDESLALDADPVRLAQVFSNLLDNASKYTPQGGAVALAVVAHDGVAQITVSDDGRGIAATAMPHIFELFAQDPRTVAMGRGGLGIGLAVVRELVESHGGTIAAHSAGEDLGTRMVVTLPLTASLAGR